MSDECNFNRWAFAERIEIAYRERSRARAAKDPEAVSLCLDFDEPGTHWHQQLMSSLRKGWCFTDRSQGDENAVIWVGPDLSGHVMFERAKQGHCTKEGNPVLILGELRVVVDNDARP